MGKPYSSYTLEDLIDNQSFRKWIKDPDSDQEDFWQEWLYQYPEKASLVVQARQIILDCSEDDCEESFETDITEVWSRIVKQNDEYDEMQALYIPRRNIAAISFQWAAVSIGILLTSTLLWYIFREDRLLYQTHYGEIKTVTLPDGSTVQLNANSSIRYNKKWAYSQTREIWLDGEAFFSVKHTSHHQKFLVHTPQVTVEVVGTQFDVNTRRTSARIVLSEGKIKLNDFLQHSDPLEMHPGDFIEVNRAIDTLIRKRVNPDDYTSWKQNKLVFDDVVLSEVAALLEDNYGFEVSFQDQEIAGFTFTGSVNSDKIPLLFTILEKTFRIHINRNGNKITMSKSPSGP